ncbi:MAG: hypothetical protein AAB706_00115 [Patescibacteria group bacterium]
MKNATISIQVFGLYLLALSLVLILLPSELLSFLKFSVSDPIWFRVLGIPLFVIGLHYQYAAFQGDVMFFHVTTIARLIVCLLFIAFVLLKWLEPQAVLFGVTDAFGATWTWWALKKGHI